jgi:hypothetical protein
VAGNERSDGLHWLETIPDPFPKASFGSIGRFVRLECDPPPHLTPPRLTISYTEEDLGWVDPSSLRIFEVNEETGEFHLVFRSRPDQDRMEVRGSVERSGIYGIIGLPRDERILRVIQALNSLIPPLGDVDGIEVTDIVGTVCGRILCVEPGGGDPLGDLVPPGGMLGDACQFCLGREVPSNGLPEFQLLPYRPHRQPWGKTPPPPPVPAGPYLYALLTDGVNQIGSIEIVDLSQMSYVQTIQLGPATGISLAPTPHGTCVVDWVGGNVIIIDAMGGRRTVPVGPNAFYCVASRDGALLYVSAQGSLVVIDVAAAQITRSIPAIGQEWFRRLALSPDGLTLAAGTMRSSFVYLFDTATLAPRRVTISDPGVSPTFPEHVGFTDTGLVLVWDGESDRMYTVDAATGTQRPGVMDDLVPDLGGEANISYIPGKRGACTTRGVLWRQIPPGDLVVVDVQTLTGSVRGGFAGTPFATCLDPRDGKTLYVSVTIRISNSVTLDAYDAQADAFARGVYTFRNVNQGIPFGIRDMAITS